MSVDSDVAAVAARQHGLIARRQALGAGCSASAIARRLRSGRWLEVHQGVYLIAGVPRSWRCQVMGACLATGGFASHRSAAVLLGLGGFRHGPVEITVGRDVRRLCGIPRVHRSTDFALADIQEIDGIPVSGPSRLVVDLGAVVSWERYNAAVDELLRRGLSWEEMLDSLVRHARRGRNGVGPLRTLLAERFREVVTDSALEQVFWRLVDGSGLPLPTPQFEVFDHAGLIGRVDFAYPAQRIAVEIDSVAFHLDRTSFDRDKVRRNRLRAAGWLVIEVTFTMLVTNPYGLLTDIRRALAARAGVGATSS